MIARKKSKVTPPEDTLVCFLPSIDSYERAQREHAKTDLLRPRVHRPSRPLCRFAKVQVETDVASAAPAPTSSAARRRAERHGRFQWGHVIARTRDQPAGLWPTIARLSPLAGASERANAQSRTTAISFSLPGCAPHGSPFSPVVEPDSLCALHNLFCNSTLRAALTGTPTRHPHSEMSCVRGYSSWRAAN